MGVAFLLVLETSASSPQPVQSSALLPMKGQVFRTAGYVCAASRDGPFPSIYVWPSGARGDCCDQGRRHRRAFRTCSRQHVGGQSSRPAGVYNQVFTSRADVRFRFYDFFAGAGLATLGLRDSWQCVWANDIAPQKRAVYAANFGDDHLVPGDVALITTDQLPKPAEMAWASFPCQDLSLAGWRKGLSAERSGVFWAFWRIMHDLALSEERPPIIVIENVVGLLYGDSFTGLCEAQPRSAGTREC